MGVDPAFWAGRRVLITGHTGFKGSWLSLWLAALGAEVTGVADAIPTDPSLFALAGVEADVRTAWVDVRDGDALAAAVAAARPEVVLHLAAQPLVRRSLEAPQETYAVNVMGTVNLLEAVRRTPGVRAVVVVTSDKCYENRGWEWPYREDEPMGGHDPYASSKGCAELVTAAYRHAFLTGKDGPRVASARAGNVVGGGDWSADRLVPDIMRAVLDGRPLAIRNPAATRPWQHVLDALGGYLLLVQARWERPDAATAWNFGPADDGSRPVRWIVERLAESWPGGVRWSPPAAPQPPEDAYLRVDSSRARARLGWTPRWDLDETLAAIVAWYLALRDGADMRAATLGQIAAYGAGRPAPRA